MTEPLTLAQRLRRFAANALIDETIAEIDRLTEANKALTAKIQHQQDAGYCDANWLSDGPPFKCGWQHRAEAALADWSKAATNGIAEFKRAETAEAKLAKVVAERDEARSEVARYWTSADIKPWCDLAEEKGLGHFGKKLKGMFIRAMRAEDEARREFDRADRLSAELAEARKIIKPFSDIAGEMFSRGWDASNVALALDNPDDPHRVTAGDFFTARDFLASEEKP